MESERHSAKNADPNGSTTERAFIARLADGDIAAYRELSERYWQPLVAYACGMLDSQDAAEDTVQESLIRLWERRTLFRSIKNLKGYLYKVVRNAANQERRKTKDSGDAALPGWAQSPPQTPAEATELGELEAAAVRAIDDLPDRRREVFVLAHFHDLSHNEIGEVLGMASSTAKKHMNLALGDLRNALQPYVDQKLKPLR